MLAQRGSVELLREETARLLTADLPVVAAVLADGPGLPTIAGDADLDQAIYRYFGARLPREVVVPGHRTPWDFVHDSFFARFPVTVAKASRGLGGKTYTFALLALCEALFLRADITVLGGTGVQSIRLLEGIGKLWKSPTAPREYLVGEPGREHQEFLWGNTITALMASQASVRGPHPQRMRLDEVDEMRYSIFESALGQPQSSSGVLSQVAIASTHQYADGTFTKILQQARAKGWPVYEWSYHETLEPHGWLTVDEVTRKRSIMTSTHWTTEVELQEPTSEGRAIDTAKVEAAFTPGACALEAKVEGEDVKYATGTDWAKKVNHTVVVTIRKDVRPMRVVCVARRQREPWPKMIGMANDQVTRYGGTACHDETGVGSVCNDYLTHASEGFQMVGQARADLLTSYVSAIERGDLIWPRDDTDPALAAAYSEHKYASRDDVYKGSKDGTGRHHLPDTISAGALAWRAASAFEAATDGEQPENQHVGLQRGRLTGAILGRRPR